MTTHERAKAAAEFLNDEGEYRCRIFRPPWDTPKIWIIHRTSVNAQITGIDLAVINIARSKGWQENQTENVPIPQENGTQGEGEV